MTPKEKAKELIDKFDIGEQLPYHSIKHALIAVNEILKAKELNYIFTQEQINCMEGTSDDRWIYETYMEYWQEVKNEIQKL